MEVTCILMSSDEARVCVQQIKANVQATRALLFDLYEREGWRALGYENWRQCVTKELDMSVPRAYQMLSTVKVEHVLLEQNADSTTVESAVVDLPERHARELAPLLDDEDALREVYAEVQQSTDGQPTAVAYREAVGRRIGADESSPAVDSTPPADVDGVAPQLLPPVLDPSRLLPGQQEKARYSRGVKSLHTRLFDLVRDYPSSAGAKEVARQIESQDFNLSAADYRRLKKALTDSGRGRIALIRALETKRPRRRRKGHPDGSTP